MAALVRVKRIAKGIFFLKAFSWLPHQLDGLDCLGGVKMGALGGNDNEIRAAHGVARHHGRRAFQVHNDEIVWSAAFSMVSMMDSSVVVAIT